jgi:hypothetical protein
MNFTFENTVPLKKARMKKPPVSGLSFLFVALTTLSTFAQPNSEPNQTLRERFIGGWRLVWLEEEGADGNVHRADCTGLLAYTADGHMSVQVMHRDAQPESAVGQAQYAQGGYEATYGRYSIDEKARTFTFHVEGALVRSLVGKDLTRRFEFSGKQMIVQATDPKEHWRFAWEHY